MTQNQIEFYFKLNYVDLSHDIIIAWNDYIYQQGDSLSFPIKLTKIPTNAQKITESKLHGIYPKDIVYIADIYKEIINQELKRLQITSENRPYLGLKIDSYLIQNDEGQYLTPKDIFIYINNQYVGSWYPAQLIMEELSKISSEPNQIDKAYTIFSKAIKLNQTSLIHPYQKFRKGGIVERESK